MHFLCLSYLSIYPTNPRTNPWNFCKKILRIGGIEKLSFFESAIFFQNYTYVRAKFPSVKWLEFTKKILKVIFIFMSWLGSQILLYVQFCIEPLVHTLSLFFQLANKSKLIYNLHIDWVFPTFEYLFPLDMLIHATKFFYTVLG